MNDAHGSGTTHPIIPLSLLESVRAIDLPPAEDPSELEREVGRRRLGANPTVANQIDRYRALVGRGRNVPEAEALDIMRLCGRRADAHLVFSDAGRRAADRALGEMFVATRIASRTFPGRLGRAVAWSALRRLALHVFDIRMNYQNGVATGYPRVSSLSVAATDDGSGCLFFGSAVAGLLRALTDFEGAVDHNECVVQGASRCAWHARIPFRG